MGANPAVGEMRHGTREEKKGGRRACKPSSGENETRGERGEERGQTGLPEVNLRPWSQDESEG